jgi:hypothetical protein
MKKKSSGIIISILITLGCLSVQAFAFSPFSEKGPYFVRALNITVPLRNDLRWGQVSSNFNRDQVGIMRFTGRIYYPAVDSVQTSDQYSIFYPADTSDAPYPAVIFIQGANVAIEQYTWLFEHISSYGYIVLAITEYMASGANLEGQFPNLYPLGVISPGVWLTDMIIPDAVTYLENINASVHDPLPEHIGATYPIGDYLPILNGYPLALPIPPDYPTNYGIIDCVRNPRGPTGDDLNHSLFEGMVDTNKIVLAGHSMGGFLSLMCACTTITKPPRPNTNPQISFTNHVVGCFVYGAHTFASSGTGYPTPLNVPLLMLAGEKDGVAAGSVNGEEKSGYERIKYTFENYIPASANNSRHLIGIKGANHLSIGTKPDPMIDRSFLDEKDGIISSYIAHRILQDKITAFLEYYTKGNASAFPVITESGSDPFVFDYAAK